MSLTYQQRIERKKGLGGSDCAAILGLSPWATPLDIFFDKLNYDEPELEEITPNQRWGNLLEPIIISEFERITGLSCEPNQKLRVHPDYPFMRANIDAYIPEINAILECKTADYFVAQNWKYTSQDDIPHYYLVQCAHYAAVYNVEIVYIAVLISINDFRIYKYTRTPELERIIIDRESAFWNGNVLTKYPPQPSDLNDVKKLWSKSTEGLNKSVDEYIESVFWEMSRIKAQVRDLTKLIETQQMYITDFMQDAETLTDAQGKMLATWKSQKSNRVDLDKLKKEHPTVYDECIKETQTRVFRIKEVL
jgi:putative phage-type endonuclease